MLTKIKIDIKLIVKWYMSVAMYHSIILTKSYSKYTSMKMFE